MTVILGYARTPFVKSNGQFAAIPATELGAIAVREALARAGVAPDDVEAVFGGQALQAGAGQNPARQTSVRAGISLAVPALTLNVVCLSGAEAVAWAHQLITSGGADVVVAVGQESMSQAPHAWIGSRAGKRFGPIEMIDTMEIDGLTDAFDGVSMGSNTEVFAAAVGIGRAEQDAWAAASHQRAADSADLLGAEIVSVETGGRRSITVSHDDGVRADSGTATLSTLRPAFATEGTITAGNSSQISDGAAAVVLSSDRWAADRGLHPLAEIVAHALVAGPDTSLLAQPAQAINAALRTSGHTVSELAAVEINEAFAAVALLSSRLLGVDDAIVNPHGGAIALGHPIGASGTRIIGHLALTLNEGQMGAAGICGGGGQGSALVLRGMAK